MIKNNISKYSKIVSLCVLAVLFCMSCEKKETIDGSTNATGSSVAADSPQIITDSTTTAVSNGMVLQTFGFPPEVEGCSCYFARNKADFEAEKFVYIDDYGNNAFIKTENKLHKITMQEGDFDPSNFQKVIEDEYLKVEMKGVKKKEMYEVMMFEGEMQVINKKTGAKTTTPIYGECGC